MVEEAVWVGRAHFRSINGFFPVASLPAREKRTQATCACVRVCVPFYGSISVFLFLFLLFFGFDLLCLVGLNFNYPPFFLGHRRGCKQIFKLQH